jgi:hypothetical protein
MTRVAGSEDESSTQISFFSKIKSDQESDDRNKQKDNMLS